MKNIFLISVFSAFILPISGAMEFDSQDSPGTTAAAAPTYAAAFSELTDHQIAELNETAQLAYVMIHKIRQRFATKDLNTHVLVPVKKLKEKVSVLLPLFVKFFKADPKKGFTPLNKELLKKFGKSIEMLSPASFVKCDGKTFEASVEMGRFPVILETHNDNVAYIPDWFIETEFALYRQATTDNKIKSPTTTKKETTFGEYNLLSMLKGGNPQSLSGITEYHHIYQTDGYFTPICYSFHKNDSKKLHRARGISLINRSNCTSDFSYTSKYVAGIQILKMLKIIFEYNDEVYGVQIHSNTKEMINAILRSPGNVDVIPQTSLIPAANPPLLEQFIAVADEDDNTDSAESDSSCEYGSRRDSFVSGITDTSSSGSSTSSFEDLESANSDTDSSSRDSVELSSSLVQTNSVSSAVTDGSLSNETTSHISQRKKLRARRPAASTSSVTKRAQEISIAGSSDEASQQSTQPEKRDRNARKIAGSEDPLTGKENIGQSPARKKKPANRTPLSPSS